MKVVEGQEEDFLLSLPRSRSHLIYIHSMSLDTASDRGWGQRRLLKVKAIFLCDIKIISNTFMYISIFFCSALLFATRGKSYFTRLHLLVPHIDDAFVYLCDLSVC
jgi:hypothetical protein